MEMIFISLTFLLYNIFSFLLLIVCRKCLGKDFNAEPNKLFHIESGGVNL